MARGQWLTPRQKGIVRRYYENRETGATQKLGEVVSELYTCEDEKRATRLWRSALTALVNAGVHRGRAERIVAERDLEHLARLVGEIF